NNLKQKQEIFSLIRLQEKVKLKVINKNLAILFIVLSFAVILSFIFDNLIVQNISKLRNGFLDKIFLGITSVSSEIIIFFFLTSLFLWQEHKRKWILPLWLTLFFSVALSFILKVGIQRLRPFQLNLVSIPEMLMSKSYEIWNFSFPSFQAMLVFCAIPIISKEFRKIKWIWIIFAFLVAFSRVYFGVHFLSDVIIGGVLGYLIGILVIKLVPKGISFGVRKKRFGERIFRKNKRVYIRIKEK
ncbi:MAG: phosphatase PAP2 family protein, partial [Nanoarchaeota archaeon]